MPKGIYDRKKAKRAKRISAPKKASTKKKKRGRPPGSGTKKKAVQKSQPAAKRTPKPRAQRASGSSGLSREDFIGGMRAIAGAISEIADAIRETRQGAVKGEEPQVPAPEAKPQVEAPGADERAGATASAESMPPN
jgi:hypothetical protein